MATSNVSLSAGSATWQRMSSSFRVLFVPWLFFAGLFVVLSNALPVDAADVEAPAQGGDTIDLQLDADAVSLRSTDDTVSDYTIVLSSAEKKGRELLTKDEQIVSGRRSRRLWQWPKEASAKKVIAGLAHQLDGVTLFECEGSDCGRSNVWSTLVFSEALMYGPSRDQHYRVIRSASGDLHVLYVVRRGNRRVHALYERLTADTATGEEVAETRSINVIAALASTGMARLEVAPEADGSLSLAANAQLERIGGELAGFSAGEIYAVCHLYSAGLPRDIGGSRKERSEKAKALAGQDPVVGLLEASERCAAKAANALRLGMAAATFEGLAEPSKNRQRPESLTFESFGAGPLQPTDSAVNRIELVVPSRFILE